MDYFQLFTHQKPECVVLNNKKRDFDRQTFVAWIWDVDNWERVTKEKLRQVDTAVLNTFNHAVFTNRIADEAEHFWNDQRLGPA